MSPEPVPQHALRTARGERRRALVFLAHEPHEPRGLKERFNQHNWYYGVMETDDGDLALLYLSGSAERFVSPGLPELTSQLVGRLSAKIVPAEIAEQLTGLPAPFCFDRLRELLHESRLFLRSNGQEMIPEVDDGQ